jgi:hypothetical protein
MSKKAIRNMGIFIFLVIISGWIGVLVDSLLTDQPEGDSLGMGIWLVLPLLTAFIIILFSKASWRDLGLKPNFKGNIKWYLVSVLIFSGCYSNSIADRCSNGLDRLVPI